MAESRAPIDRNVGGVRYQYTVHPAGAPDDLTVVTLLDRDPSGPSVADHLSAVLGDLFRQSFSPRDNLFLYGNRSGGWEEIVVWPGHAVDLEPVGVGQMTVDDAVATLRGELYEAVRAMSDGDERPTEASPGRGHGGCLVSADGEIIVAVSLLGTKGVTNDPRGVIGDLKRSGYDLQGSRVVYCDATGSWDELVVRDGDFVGARALHGAEGVAQALEQARGPDSAKGAIVADSAWLRTVRDLAGDVAPGHGRERDRDADDGRDR